MNEEQFTIFLNEAMRKLIGGDSLERIEYQAINAAEWTEIIESFGKNFTPKFSRSGNNIEYYMNLEKLRCLFSNEMYDLQIEEETTSLPQVARANVGLEKLFAGLEITDEEALAIRTMKQSSLLISLSNLFSRYVKSAGRDAFLLNMTVLKILASGNTPTLDNVEIHPIGRQEVIGQIESNFQI